MNLRISNYCSLLHPLFCPGVCIVIISSSTNANQRRFQYIIERQHNLMLIYFFNNSSRNLFTKLKVKKFNTYDNFLLLTFVFSSRMDAHCIIQIRLTIIWQTYTIWSKAQNLICSYLKSLAIKNSRCNSCSSHSGIMLSVWRFSMRHERTLLNGDKIFLLFSYHVIHCNLANKPDRGLILNQFEDRGLSGGRGGGRGY